MRTLLLAPALLAACCFTPTDSGGTTGGSSSGVAASSGSGHGGSSAGSSGGSTSAGSTSAGSSGAGSSGGGSTGNCGYPIPSSCAQPSGICPPCGQPGQACCQSGPSCDCQDYGRELCLGQPTAQDGHAGDACTLDGGCDPGLACLPFGINSFCQECGGPGEPCCAAGNCQSSLTCQSCANTGGNEEPLCLPPGSPGGVGCPAGCTLCHYSCFGGSYTCNEWPGACAGVRGCACILDAGAAFCGNAGIASCGEDGGVVTFECVEGC